MLRRDGFERSLLGEARIRHNDVYDTFPELDRRCDSVYVCESRKIPRDGRDVLANHGRCLVQFRLSARGDEDVRAFFDKPLGRGQADSAIAAGDYSYLSI